MHPKSPKWALAIAAVSLAGVLLLSSVAVQAQESSPAHSTSTCPSQSKGRLSSSDFYKGVTRVVLTMELPWNWQEAWDCHGHETECADKLPQNGPLVRDRKSYLDWLLKSYQPHKALTPDILKRDFTLAVKQRLLPRIPPDDSCHAPEFVTEEVRMAYPPGSLIVRVQMALEPGAPVGDVVALRAVLYRPDLPASMQIQRLFRPFAHDIAPISLSWPDDKVSAAVSSYIGTFFMSMP